MEAGELRAEWGRGEHIRQNLFVNMAGPLARQEVQQVFGHVGDVQPLVEMFLKGPCHLVGLNKEGVRHIREKKTLY